MTALNKVLKKGILLGPAFKLHQLVVMKDAVPRIVNFIMECCKLAIEQKSSKKQVNTTCWKVGKLFGHFPSKIRFVLLVFT